MRRRLMLILYTLLLLSTFANVVLAADESSFDKFLGSPLLILVAVIIIDVVLLVYHKLRK